MVIQYAPGWPGIPPRWTSSAKTGIGTAISPASHVWFTLSHGIFNEIYYPRVDQACTRDMGLIVTDGADFFSEEKRHTHHKVECLKQGIPAYLLTNTCKQGTYRIEKEIVSDPRRDVVLQYTRFVPLKGKLDDYHIYVLLAPHLGNRGTGNTAWIGDYKGVPMLFAEREGNNLALGCSAPWLKRSVGFVGFSDGWQDLARNKRMTWAYDRAENGNVALIGEVDLKETEGIFVLALGFGRKGEEAGHRALASLLDGFEVLREEYIDGWQSCQKTLFPLQTQRKREFYQISCAVLRVHESKYFPGGLIASLSIPWGFSKSDDDLGGYHLVWPRDLVEAAGGLLAAGGKEDVYRMLYHLETTQEADGHWPQNMWLDGSPYWGGIQMDETAFPILLVNLAHRYGVLESKDLKRLWRMVHRAASYLVKNGPVTPQDRWEEDPGYSPFTLSVEIAALLAAADLADLNGESVAATYLREKADAWNANVERWTYVTDTDLAKQVGVEGYYVRIAPPEISDAPSPLYGFVPIKNRPLDKNVLPARHIISPDALALVRFGLRAPDDPRIVNTVKVIDALLKVETPYGPAWHRYNDDGYGEHSDGAPFDGAGVGRAWPLLTGERAHYELAAGRCDVAEKLLKTFEAFANDGGMIPEQVWDSTDIPERRLFLGKHSGSAMPLVWAHAEYVKLCRSLHEGYVFDMPRQTVERYVVKKTASPHAIWNFGDRCRSIPIGKILRLELFSPATVHWSSDGWSTFQDIEARDTHLGIFVADLPTDRLPAGTMVHFTFYWLEETRWEKVDYSVIVE
ncbi:MAG TPA: glucan 1,4-alpha-glucosidase [Thermodesulfobacteriota bacterium]|nr:glucan 1,4-alpha-glucosidase [Thermodesulfobacteriota bacterium]